MVAREAFASAPTDVSLGSFARLAEMGEEEEDVEIFVMREEAPRAETVKWSLPVTALTGDGFSPVTAEGDRCLVSVL